LRRGRRAWQGRSNCRQGPDKLDKPDRQGTPEMVDMVAAAAEPGSVQWLLPGIRQSWARAWYICLLLVYISLVAAMRKRKTNMRRVGKPETRREETADGRRETRDERRGSGFEGRGAGEPGSRETGDLKWETGDGTKRRGKRKTVEESVEML
jgi:hypothetical protein